MATFTVKYRSSDGALAEEVIEADSRTSAFDLLKTRGIVPISVAEGGRLPSSQKIGGIHAGANGKALVKGIAAGLAVVALAVSAWWLLSSRSPETPKTVPVPKPKVEKVAPKAVASKPVAVVTNVPKAVEPPAQVAQQEDLGEWHGQKVVARSARTNDNGTVVQILKTADGKSHRVTTPPKPVFDNASDQLIAMAVSGAEHDSMAPMPLSPSIEAEFKKSLEKPIVINETDSDEVKRMKQAVMEVREELKKVVAEGGSVQEALARHQRMVNDNGKVRAEAQKEIRRYLDEGDVEGAKKYVKTINQTLEQMGVKAISMPMTREERKAMVEEKKKAQEALNAYPDERKEN